jgi:hypothetical protein
MTPANRVRANFASDSQFGLAGIQAAIWQDATAQIGIPGTLSDDMAT